MIERTSSLCASLVTQESTQREVIVGTEERVIHTNDGYDSRLQNFFIFICNDGHDSHFTKGRGGQNRYGSFVRVTVPPLRVYFLRFWTGY